MADHEVMCVHPLLRIRNHGERRAEYEMTVSFRDKGTVQRMFLCAECNNTLKTASAAADHRLLRDQIEMSDRRL